MTVNQRIRRAAQEVESGWSERDVERVWQGLKRKRRRRAIAAGSGVATLVATGVAVWAMLVVPARHAMVGTEVRPAPPSQRDEPIRFADGSTAVPWGGHQASLAVVEDRPERVVVALTKGGARFEVTPRAERVFVVRAGEVTVSVLGTAFSIERVADRVGVTVTRGAVKVDWGVGAQRMVAGDDGWFPPLVVSPLASPMTSEGHAEATPKKVRPAGEDGARSGVAPPRRIARNEQRGPAGDGAARAATTPPAGTTVESTARAVSPATEPSDGPAAAAGREATAAARLLAEADRARLAGRFEEGAALLQRLVREHPGDQLAPLAAFSLGRLLLGELGRPAQAAQAFARARALAPHSPLADDALAREAEAWAQAGNPDRARAREAEYRARARKEGGPRP